MSVMMYHNDAASIFRGEDAALPEMDGPRALNFHGIMGFITRRRRPSQKGIVMLLEKHGKRYTWQFKCQVVLRVLRVSNSVSFCECFTRGKRR